ncbi:MBOAT family O-acyltransferase [Noviherbaspirillum galbum]|uniref:Probable alginate O-acetylase AlgI n=1 Tax=Noviherbaspirillum galbum TaxID=2709383 RepID=A0A6B3SWE8_9BURK|nr:MBOAT family protein [Noviherbaspirillum galbum]NEX62712.1 MBOAT family protein [Noviherbaspirillum galbum]
MLYNSYEFIFLYLPLVFCGFFLVARKSHQLAALWLALASLFFYGWWNPKFVALLVGSILFNFGAGYLIGKRREHDPAEAKMLLIGAITGNLALLGYFKYTNFFITTFNGLSGQNVLMLDIILPLGISFFTFTQIAFLVDVYRGIAKEYRFVHYLLFVTYFPHLIAGPVLHHKQMMPQFAAKETYRINWDNVAIGLTIFALGLCKKVLIADSLEPIANGVFNGAHRGENLMLFDAWAGALAYAFQLYFDFSGYSDMAIGLSRMFNVKLPLNFNSPYRATSIIDFWRRWHITLSTFLRDYLYIPLGGNRQGVARRHANLMLTMLLGGLWHGANWTFVVWGGLHGVYLVINHLWRVASERMGIRKLGPAWLRAGTGWLITFLCALVAWVFFRAENFNDASMMLQAMAGMRGLSVGVSAHLPAAVMSLVHSLKMPVELLGFLPLATGASGLSVLEVGLLLLMAATIAWTMPNTQQLLHRVQPALEPVARPAYFAGLWSASSLSSRIAVGMLLGCAIFAINRQSTFLYFQF